VAPEKHPLDAENIIGISNLSRFLGEPADSGISAPKMRFGSGPAAELGSVLFPVHSHEIRPFLVSLRINIIIAIDLITRAPYMRADLASARGSALSATQLSPASLA
jgi:hypothetical protein